MHRQELRLWERVPGKDHHSTLTSMNNLTDVLAVGASSVLEDAQTEVGDCTEFLWKVGIDLTLREDQEVEAVAGR